MRKIATWSFVLVLIILTACSKYDDSELWKSLNDLEKRVAAMETTIGKLNADLTTMQALVAKLDGKIYISKVETNADGSYTIYFTDNSKVTIANGKEGTASPVVGVAKDTDGLYYWTLTSDGKTSWLLDAEGHKMLVSEKGITPLLKVDDKGYWVFSDDKGVTWNYILGIDNQPVSALGEQGEVGDSFFKDVTEDVENVYFTLSDGSIITVPKRSDFYLMVKLAPQTALFIPGETKRYEVESVGVIDVVLNKPTGWRVAYADQALSITAPAKDAVSETEGEVSIIYFGSNDRSSLVKIGVAIDKDFTGVTDGDNFTVNIISITDTRVQATVTGKNSDMEYYVYPYDPVKTDDECITQLRKRFAADVADGPEYVDYFYKGTANYNYSNLAADVDYSLGVVGVKFDRGAKTLEILTPLMKIPFTTKRLEVINTVYRMTISNLSWYGASCAIHPSDDLFYFHAFVKKTTFDEALDDADFAQSFIDNRYLYPYYTELYDTQTLAWSNFTVTGDQTLATPGFLRRDPLWISEDIYPLEANTDYYVVAFGCDASGNFSNSRVARTLIRTKSFVPTQQCTFVIETAVDQQDIAIKVIPSDKTTTYITFIDERDSYQDNFATALQYPPYDLYWRTQNLKPGQTIKDNDCFYKGDAAYKVVGLKAATAYIVFAYGCTAEGVITTAPQIVEVHTRGTVDVPSSVGSSRKQQVRPAYRVLR